MKNKKGLSTVVTTLIIILLVLVAVGIIWGVVNNLLSKSSDTIESSTKCLDISVKGLRVVYDPSDSTGDYNVTLQRSGSGGNEDIYAKVIFYSDANNSAVLDWDTALRPLDTKTTPFLDTGVANASRLEVTPYYLDDTGNEKICASGTTTTFRF